MKNKMSWKGRGRSWNGVLQNNKRYKCKGRQIWSALSLMIFYDMVLAPCRQWVIKGNHFKQIQKKNEFPIGDWINQKWIENINKIWYNKEEIEKEFHIGVSCDESKL